ncbi:hypothetical protein KM043_005416 [Ampulex compressa]|nr:hypothetical protein KM043_005416 [Ampulex compressa]
MHRVSAKYGKVDHKDQRVNRTNFGKLVPVSNCYHGETDVAQDQKFTPEIGIKRVVTSRCREVKAVALLEGGGKERGVILLSRDHGVGGGKSNGAVVAVNTLDPGGDVKPIAGKNPNKLVVRRTESPFLAGGYRSRSYRLFEPAIRAISCLNPSRRAVQQRACLASRPGYTNLDTDSITE